MIKRDKSTFSRYGDLLTVKEVAVLLGVHEVTVRMWARNGQLKAQKIGARLWRFRKDDIMQVNENGVLG